MILTGLGGCVSETTPQLLQASVPPVVDAKERNCVLRAMYFESSRSSYDGLMAVGTVVVNRKNSGLYPSTLCGVVGQSGQFAAGALRRTLSARESSVAERAADDIMAGKRHANMEGVLYFHTAGLHFHYPNMHYRLVAGGNAFYQRYERRPFLTAAEDTSASEGAVSVQNAAAPASASAASATLAYAAADSAAGKAGDQPSIIGLLPGDKSSTPAEPSDKGASTPSAALASSSWPPQDDSSSRAR